MKIEPYSDDYMFFDSETNHYILTEKALVERAGVNLRERIADRSLISPEIVIKSFTTTVSEMIYAYIHEFNLNNQAQDCLIATCEEFRKILLRAMTLQAVYVLNVGNLYLSTNPDERANAIDHLAKSVLDTVVREYGIAITFTGRL